MKTFVIFFVLFLNIATTKTWAFNDALMPELIPSSRGLGMGNAFIGRVNDSAAPFYNPSGLGAIRGNHLRLSNFYVEVNKGWFDSGVGGKIWDSFSLDNTRKFLEKKNDGILSHNRFAMTPNFTTRFFSLGFLLKSEVMSFIKTEENTLVREYHYWSRQDYGPYISSNISLLGGVFKFGMTATMLFRKEGIGVQDVSQKVDKNNINKENTFLLTTGMRVTLPYTYLPTFSATLHNTTGSSLGNKVTLVKRNLVVGASITPKFSNSTKLHLEVDYRDTTNRYDKTKTKRKISVGAELDFARSFFMRLGMFDRRVSGGVGFRMVGHEVNLTSYALDGDRRYVLGLSFAL